MKYYLWPKQWMLNVILDAAELQKAELIEGDTANGILTFAAERYGQKYFYRVNVQDLPRNRSSVEIEIVDATKKASSLVLGQYALIDSLMTVLDDSG